MKRRFYLVPAAISLVCAQASFANDIENAITKYGGKIGIKGSAANLINSQIHKVTSSGAASTAGAASAAPGGPTTSTITSTTTTTTSKTSSFKNALQQVFSKSDSAAPVTNNPAATLNSLSSGTGSLGQPGQPAAVVPGVAAPHKQSVKAKIGKEIWRQAKRYESKHPNKLMHTGVNSLSKVVGQP
ncbi:hypothetical protein KA344_21460 [bacterium]|jgi:hypothetical protein|nr:hypothetical protein [bacterium]MDQ5935201.1 hypothetical protein [Cyanobacteriota bacterium erpe_2018_sw_21hr_WHONDRS-SW48-000092_B_bin.40]